MMNGLASLSRYSHYSFQIRSLNDKSSEIYFSQGSKVLLSSMILYNLEILVRYQLLFIMLKLSR